MSSSSTKFPPNIPDWNNLSVLHRNTLPPRSYFFPYPSAEAALKRDVTNSGSDSISLSGTWKFYHAANPYEEPPCGADAKGWGDIQVPGMWQLQGYGKPVYTNTNYHFPVDPPNIPVEENETGHYVRVFEVPEKLRGHQLRLRFEGVDSAYHVYLNDREIGYHQGSRNPAEFDITSFVKDGENKLALRVYRFCDGSYIEDQDQWRASGIFRDVFLVGFTESHIEDLHIQTDLDDQYKDAELSVKFKIVGKGNLTVKVLDADKKELDQHSSEVDKDATVSFKLSDPKKWTAETPNLYYVLASFGGQSVIQQVGFRKTEIKNGLFVVNGKRICFRGANRHEHHPKFGRAVPYDFMKQDLLLMKRYNLNAVRTSHQPSDPRLYELANELGLWIMDEADLECHGFTSVAENAMSEALRTASYDERKAIAHKEAAKWTTNNPEWADAYLDRAQQLVIRDKNHPSVIMWSLGNEAFYGQNFQVMYDWIRKYDDTRFVHYEGDTHAQTVDVFSRMYPTVEEIVNEFGKAKVFNKPVVLCEFAHAMGTGPGAIKEYIDAFYEYPRLQGGWVWEWANHGLLTETENGEKFYGYGGDFGEDVHDYNFVMDGVLFSDHTPAPGLIEYAKAIEPVQLVEGSSAQSVQIINRYDIVELDHLRAEAKYNIDGKDISAGEVRIPQGVGPGQTTKLELNEIIEKAPKEAFAIEVSFSPKAQPSWAETASHRLAWFQLPIGPPLSFTPTSSPSPTANLTLTQESTSLIITSPTSHQTYTFTLPHGSLTQITKQGHNLLTSPPTLSFYRPLTDNDRPQDGWSWLDKRVHQLRSRTSTVEWTCTEHTVRITVHSKIAPPVLAWGLDVTTTYTITALSGPEPESLGLKISVAATPYGEYPPESLPRIGLSFGLESDFEGVEWFGRGPGQAYCDMKFSQGIGYHSLPISELWVPYEFPQEAGNRTDVEFVDFVGGGERRLRAVFVGEKGSFSACHYREKDIDRAEHPFELEKCRTEDVQVRVDWRHHGLGTGSCGPRTREEYRLKYGAFEYEVWFI